MTAAPCLKSGDKVLFIGDSITDAGRRLEHYAPYGRGYVQLIQALLPARFPELEVEVVNRGVNGNTIRHLAGRWSEDVIAEQPAWVSIMVGINDVWGTLYGRENAVSLAEFARTYRQLLDSTRERTDARLVLMEPYVGTPPLPPGAAPLDVDEPGALEALVPLAGMSLDDVRRDYPPLRQQRVRTGPIVTAALVYARALVDAHRTVVRGLAGEYKAVLVRTQDAFDAAMRARPALFWSPDHVHASPPGHGLLALAWLRALGGEVS